jgi:uncharacterized protein YfcZ (UPF0381/DUF406 family)
LQKVVDELTAKNMELEAELKSMTEKATNIEAEFHEVKTNLENQL